MRFILGGERWTRRWTEGCLQSACGAGRGKALRGRGRRSLSKRIADSSVAISPFPKVEVRVQQPLNTRERDPQVQILEI